MRYSLIFHEFSLKCAVALTVVSAMTLGTSQALATSACPQYFTFLGYLSEQAYWETTISGECSKTKTITAYNMQTNTAKQIHKVDYDVLALKDYLAERGEHLDTQEQEMLEKAEQYPAYKQALVNTLEKANTVNLSESPVYPLGTRSYELKKECTEICNATLVEKQTGCTFNTLLKKGDHYVLDQFPKQVAKVYYNTTMSDVFIIGNHCDITATSECYTEQPTYNSQTISVFDVQACLQ